MIRRPPSAIPLRQSDVEELEAHLAEKRAEAESKEVSELQQAGEKQTKTSKSKGKGKGKDKQRASAAMDDSLVQAEEQDKAQRENMTKSQRIGA